MLTEIAQPRVLHVTSGNLFGGIERMLLTIAAVQQPDCRHDIAVGFDDFQDALEQASDAG